MKKKIQTGRHPYQMLIFIPSICFSKQIKRVILFYFYFFIEELFKRVVYSFW